MSNELEILKQFFSDAEDGARGSDFNEAVEGMVIAKCAKYRLDQVSAEGSSIIKKDQTITVIEGQLTKNGGTITIRRGVLTNDIDTVKGEYMGILGIEQVFLIEAPEYRSKDVEPYNRQQPFYIGHRFESLEKEVVDGWNIYRRKPFQTNVHFSLNETRLNTFWKIVKFGVIVKPWREVSFHEELLPNILPANIASVIIDHIKNLD